MSDTIARVEGVALRARYVSLRRDLQANIEYIDAPTPKDLVRQGDWVVNVATYMNLKSFKHKTEALKELMADNAFRGMGEFQELCDFMVALCPMIHRVICMTNDILRRLNRFEPVDRFQIKAFGESLEYDELLSTKGLIVYRLSEESGGVVSFQSLGKVCNACFSEISQKRHKCGGCHMVRYCSRDCQRTHWEFHREDCKTFQEK